MPFDMEHQLGELTNELKRVGDDVKRTAEAAQNEVKKFGELTAETKATADKLLSDQGAINEKVTKLEGRLEAGEAQNLAMEQALAERRPNGGKAVRQSLGQAIATHDGLKAFSANNFKGQAAFQITNAITSIPASAGALIYSDREAETVSLARQSLRIRDLLMPGGTTSNSVEYRRQLARTNNAAIAAETTLKPESNYTWEAADAKVKTIAHWVAVSKQAMGDAAQLESEIDGELRYGLDLVEDAQLLAGDGVGENFEGLITAATAYSGAAEAKITAPSLIDKLRVALLEASLALYPADGIVLNPEDWMVVETQKDADNRYIFANPTGIAGPVLWGRNVVPTLSMSVDKFLVGAFRMAAQIYDREETEVTISSEDRDNFVKNMLTVLAEKRLALAIKRPQALIYGDFGLVV